MKAREALEVFYKNFELWKANNYLDTEEDEDIREAYTVLEELVNEKERLIKLNDIKWNQRNWYRVC